MLREAGLEWHGPVHVMLTKRDDEMKIALGHDKSFPFFS
jgi:hypothetical protein